MAHWYKPHQFITVIPYLQQLTDHLLQYHVVIGCVLQIFNGNFHFFFLSDHPILKKNENNQSSVLQKKMTSFSGRVEIKLVLRVIFGNYNWIGTNTANLSKQQDFFNLQQGSCINYQHNHHTSFFPSVNSLRWSAIKLDRSKT